MRIGLNLLYLLPDLVGGTQIYAEELMKGLATVDKENEYIVFLNREAAALPLPEGFQRVVCPISALSRFKRYLWEQGTFPRFLRPFKLDVLHSLGYVGPLRTPCPHAVTIHDISYIGMGKAMPRSRRLTLGVLVPRCARRADRVIAVSEFSRREIAQHTGAPLDKIDVTLEACRELPPPARESWDELATQYAVAEPYLVAFSSTGGHKNLARLVKAFAQVADEVPHHLLFIGRLAKGGDTSGGDIARAVEGTGLENRVSATGYIPEDHILPLLQHADAFAFPSWYEGFGLPVLEAQRAGLPVACSMAASLPEVAGDAAIYFDPLSTEEMADALRSLLTDPTRRQALAQASTENVRRFSWEQTARETLRSYHHAIAAYTLRTYRRAVADARPHHGVVSPSPQRDTFNES